MDIIGGSFTVIDYIVFIALLVISFSIGIASACKGNKSPEEYLLGNRSLGTVPVAMSLLTSFISAINIVGFSAEVYMYGSQLSLISFGCMIGIGISILIILPVIYPLKLTSINEYIEMRFQSTRLQIFIMILVFFNAIIFMGICLYATALSLSAVTNISYQTFILVMGILCTVYSTVGGIRAVVWTDVFQLVVMCIGLLVITIAGIVKIGGISSLISISMKGKRLQLFNMNPSIYERHNFYNTLAFGTFFYGAIFSVSQVNTQRISAVPTLKESKKVLLITMFGMAIIHIFLFTGGLLAYAFYAGCDPFLENKIEKREEILSFLIVDKFGHLCGLPGLFVATLVSSTLSSFSSVVNALVALAWKDVLSKLSIFSASKPTTSAFINKILTFAIGGVFIGMAFLTSQAKSIIQLSLSVGGLSFGCIFGVFLLGMCVPTSNLKGAWSGLIGSFSFLLWIYIGALKYNKPPDILPFTNQFCDHPLVTNFTVYGNNISSILDENNLKSNDTEMKPSHLPLENSFPLMYLYGISYTLYSVIGPLLCIAIGVVVSYLTGPIEMNEVAPKLISPIFLKLFLSLGQPEMKISAKKPILQIITPNN